MILNLQEVLRAHRGIQWKHIFILTFSLITIHFLFLEGFRRGGEVPERIETDTQKPSSGDPLFDFNAVSPESKEEFDYINTVPEDGVPNKEYVAICLSVRDQARDINESITHHYHHHGIRRFYIMDDGSEPPLSTFDYTGVPRSALTFTYQDRATRVEFMQTMFYSWCIERYREKHTWIAFFDGDEFLETPGRETFREVLESFEKNDTVGAVGINWKTHTSSGVLTRPESSRKAFNVCSSDGTDDDGLIGLKSINTHIKSVVKTSHAAYPENPHKFVVKEGSYTVGENGDVITTVAFRKPITRNRLALHHYAIKSKEEFEEKLHRGNGMSDSQSKGVWEDVEYNQPKVNCTEMVDYYP